jgi:hypothetical protein
VIGKRAVSVNGRPLTLRLLLFAIALTSLVPLSSAAAATCGAKERWFVKVGTDAKASQVDVSNPVPKTVADLNALPSLRNQVPAGDNKLRLQEETRVYVVSGYLALFKNETDSDYHLVITDSTLRYTPGGPGTAGQETGTSFIAEIPDPNCTAGTQGDPSVHSVLEIALQATRQKFEARFPGGKGADTQINLPVTVTGVAFYDRQHLQTGRAVNGIELHPLLDINFGGPELQTSSSIAGTELWTNSDFEQGSGGWSGTRSTIGEYSQQPAHSGQQLCWLGGYGTTKTETLSRTLALPADANSVELKFWINISTEETSGTNPYDLLKVEVRSTSGQALKTLATFSNLNETADYVQKTFDLSEFRGRTVQVYFRASEDGGKATSFILDDVSVVKQ